MRTHADGRTVIVAENRSTLRHGGWWWPPLATALLLLVALFSPAQQLPRLNHLIQDFSTALFAHVPTDDIVIVAIDDDSINALGRWPWRRSVHAELLDRISADQPRAIALDVLFTEPDTAYPLDDALLAAAMRRSAPVVLPAFVQALNGERRVTRPLAALAQPAANMGLAHVGVDADGVVRSVRLRELIGGDSWDQLGLALLRAGGAKLPSDRFAAHADTAPMLIPYANADTRFDYVSYIDVIAGRLPPATFSGKYVLVGATAAGTGDQFATPTTSESRLMPGVEIQANVTAALLHDVRLNAAGTPANTLLNLLFVALALVGLALFSPFTAWLFTLLLALLLFALSCIATRYGLQFAPAAGILGLVFVYPLWSWQRLNTAAHFLAMELKSLQQGEYAPFAARPAPLLHDFLDRRIVALENATRQLQDLHKFVINSVDHLPHPTLICATDGTVRIANHVAALHFGVDRAQALHGHALSQLMADVVAVERHTALLPHTLPLGAHPATVEGEAEDGQGRRLIVKCVPIMNSDDTHIGWILSLVDISKLHEAERDREQAFRFIAHDIRAPLASIITLLELQRLSAGDTFDSVLPRLERHANHALAMADGFVGFSRAKSAQYHFERLDLQQLLTEAMDAAWPLGRAHGVRLTTVDSPRLAEAWVDRSLLERALTNLISNAVKFSPEGEEVTAAVTRSGQYWDVAISDRGAGIAPERQDELFQPFHRLHAASHPEIEGSGLGLAFVATVVKRHHGRIEVESAVGSGSTFHLLLPAADGAPD